MKNPSRPFWSSRHKNPHRILGLAILVGGSLSHAVVNDPPSGGSDPVLQIVNSGQASSGLNVGDVSGGTTLNNLYFRSNGTERAKIDNSGQMSIGLGSGTAASQLHIQGSNYKLITLGTSNSNSNILLSGRPTGINANFNFNSNNSNPDVNSGGFIFGTGDPDISGPTQSIGTEVFRIKRTGAVVISSTSPGDNALSINHASGGNLMVLKQGANERFVVDHTGYTRMYGRTLVTGNVSGQEALIVDHTAASGDLLNLRQAGSPKVIVNNAGKVGIGGINPTEALHVKTPNDNTWIAIDRTSTSHETGLKFMNAGATKFWVYLNDGTDNLQIQSSDPNSGDTDINPRLRIPAGNKDIYACLSGGNLGIGTTQPGARLGVAGDANITGNLTAGSIRTNTWTVAPDYVFEKDYKLASLSEVDAFVKKNKHLPEVPSAKQFKEKGMDLAEMNFTLLKKVEELTLHAIELEKKNRAQDAKLAEFEKALSKRRID